MKLRLGNHFYLKAFIAIVFFTQVIMLVDAAFQGIHECVIQNSIGCIINALLLVTKKIRGNLFLLIFFILLHLELQVFTGILIVGWELQFQYYYLGIMVFSVLMSFSIESKHLSSKQKVLGISSTLLFFASYTISQQMPPLHQLPEGTIKKVSLINYICVFTGLAVLSNLFRINAYRFAYKIKSQSFRDELTKLYNRRGIRSELDRAMDALKHEGIPYSIAIFDIDDFKQINDTYGHDTGDVVLKEIGKILLGFENELITACRWGGEEFLILRQNSIYKDTMAELAKKIAAKISQIAFESEGQSFKITITAGCSNSESELSLNKVLKIADNRLYKGKNTGKNKIVDSDI